MMPLERQKGLSLVELMISLAVGSIITAGVAQLFTANSEAYQMLQGQARIQESARFALEFMRRDIENAGNLGCNSSMIPGESTNFALNQRDSNNLPYEFDLLDGMVKGYDGQINGTWLPNSTTKAPAPHVRGFSDIPSTIGSTSTGTFVDGTGIDTSAIVVGTDILVLRGIEGADVPNFLSSAMLTSSETNIQITPPSDGVAGLGFGVGELAVIHDCEKGTLFQVTGITAGTPILLQHATGTADHENANDRLTTINTFAVDAAVSPLITTIYFVAPGTGENSSGDQPLSLWRKQGLNAPVEIVEGIEDLQVTYGIGNDTFPRRYVPANLIGDDTVFTVRVAIVANTVDDVGGSVRTTHGCAVQTCYPGESGASGIDGLQRRSFSRTLAVKN
ncbi:MAG: PilW family protein [Pseudomonadales bacterium]|nr:PilW family protein [Pseudomonadales bacterium]